MEVTERTKQEGVQNKKKIHRARFPERRDSPLQTDPPPATLRARALN